MPTPERKKHLKEGQRIIVHLDDVENEREIVQMVVEFSTQLKHVAFRSCKNLAELQACLQEIDQVGAVALLILDAYLGSLDESGQPDYFEGVKKGMELMKGGTEHTILFLSAHGNMIMEFMYQALQQEIFTNLSLSQDRVKLPADKLNPEVLLKVLTEFESQGEISPDHAQELRNLIQYLKVNLLAGVVGKPYDWADLGNIMFKFANAKDGEKFFIMKNLVDNNGQPRKEEFSSASSYFFRAPTTSADLDNTALENSGD